MAEADELCEQRVAVNLVLAEHAALGDSPMTGRRNGDFGDAILAA